MLRNQNASSRDILLRRLQTCTKTKDIVATRQVYSLVIKCGLESLSHLGDHLIRLFTSCGFLLEASYVFSCQLHRTIFTWHAIISAHTKFGDGHSAIKFYYLMLTNGIQPDKHVLTCCLKACCLMDDLHQGMIMHELAVKLGFDSAEAIDSVLIDMYASSSCVEEACQVFESSTRCDIVVWDTLMFGCAQQGQGLLSISIFERLLKDGIEPGRVTFVCVLKACSSIGEVSNGKLTHGFMIEKGVKVDLQVGNTLIDMYAKCGSVDDAYKVFCALPSRDVVSWCALISGYAEYGHSHRAINLFEKMQGEGIKPDKVTFLWVMKACGSMEFLIPGRLIHNHILQTGIKLDTGITNTLIDMYLKSGSIREAQTLYDRLPIRTTVSCGAMIAGYAQHGDGFHALEIYEYLKHEGLELTNSIFVSTLKACKSIGDADRGREVHGEVIKRVLEGDILIGNTLIDFYAKCGYLGEACFVFRELSDCNAISWGIMLTGCVENGCMLAALENYEEMVKTGVTPDKVTFLAGLKACACTGAILQGRQIHNQIIAGACEQDISISSCLVELYSRCGCIAEACKVFHTCSSRDIAMWGSMIAEYAHHGSRRQVETCLRDMECQGLKPNDELITRILSVRDHSNALDACRAYCEHVFDGGSNKVSIEHYSCIVNVLGRVGYLDEAAGLAQTMPIPPNAISWTGLLTGCGMYGHIQLGFQFFDSSAITSPNEIAFS